MRCAICDCQDDTITYNRYEGRFSPCKTCQSVIQETLSAYDEVEDDELEDDYPEDDDVLVVESIKLDDNSKT